MTTKNIHRRLSFSLTLAISAGYGLGALIAGMSPFIVETVVKQFGFSEFQAGIMVSAEVAALGLTAAVSSVFIEKANLRLLAIAGAVLAGICNILTIFATDPVSFAITRALVGVGAGLAIASAEASASSHEEYEILYSRATTMTLVMMVALFIILPSMAASLPKVGTLATLSGVAFVMIPSLLFLKRGSRALKNLTSDSSDTPMGLGKIAFFALMVALLARLCENVFWAFNLQVAALSGYSANNFGLILSLAMVLGLLVPWLANYLARRFGRIQLLIAVTITKGAIEFLLSQGATPFFAILQVILALMMAMSGLYILQLLAEVDSTGKVSALGIAAAMSAEALVPVLGGVFHTTFGLSSIGTLALALAIVTIVLAIVLLKQLTRLKQLARRKSFENIDEPVAESVQILD